MKTIRLRLRLHDVAGEQGLGLIEIVVSMFLLGLIVVGLLPILAQGMKLSATNATLAAATQLANQQVELVRADTTCGAITPATATATANGVPLKASRTVTITCPASGYPITVPVSVSVTRTDTGVVLASASTLVFVAGP